jgi:two-component system, OmpR family, sensor kinase
MDRSAAAAGIAERDALIEELREALRARDEFVAIAAHELRNPMTPILLQIGNLLNAVRDPQRSRPEVLVPRVEVLDMAVRDFVRRATTLLDVSRIAAGNLLIEPKLVDLCGILRRALDRVGPAAQVSGCTLVTELERDVAGFWDPLALEQVAENLLSNAIKFGAGQPIHVTLRADGELAQLAVRDHGIGIGPADCDRIFGRFEQAVGRRQQGGFGLGLWLTSRLVQAMDGRIAVESKLGEGATFTVTLPLQGTGQQGSKA